MCDLPKVREPVSGTASNQSQVSPAPKLKPSDLKLPAFPCQRGHLAGHHPSDTLHSFIHFGVGAGMDPERGKTVPDNFVRKAAGRLWRVLETMVRTSYFIVGQGGGKTYQLIILTLQTIYQELRTIIYLILCFKTNSTIPYNSHLIRDCNRPHTHTHLCFSSKHSSRPNRQLILKQHWKVRGANIPQNPAYNFTVSPLHPWLPICESALHGKQGSVSVGKVCL